MTEDGSKVAKCRFVGCDKHETNPNAFVAHLILYHDMHHEDAKEMARERFKDHNLELVDPDFEKTFEEMPICIDCGYHVGESDSDNGEYYCNNCRAILTEEHVREP